MRIPLLHDCRFILCVVAGTYVLDEYALRRGQVWGDVLSTALFAGYGTYCAQNFLHCREVHCAITGPGFLLAAGLMVLRITGIYDRGPALPWLVLAAAAVAGYLLEAWYRSRHRTSYLRSSPKMPP